jgi:4-amino-4-deoxy-L-arabinose transferase-like glycosyltransferase
MQARGKQAWLGHGWLADWLDRWLVAIAEPDRRNRAVAVLLLAYGLIWTLYAIISKSSQDIHFDMGEAVVWSRETIFGTPKHPPLSGWLVGFWFHLFPRQDWAYYLLSLTLICGALWAAWRIATRYLDGDKLAIALALLSFIPFYNFLGLKYNANTVMIPTWAVATWAFLRSYQTRSFGWAVAAGVAAAAVMLAKYWGVFLLASFGIAAIADQRRALYFRSIAPWVSILAGLLALSPHLAWLASNTETVTYAMDSHRSSLASASLHIPEYLLGAIGYVVVPLILVGVAAGVSPRVLRDTWMPRDPDRRMAVQILVLPVLLPIAGAVLARSQIVSLWVMASMTLLPVVLLSSPEVAISRLAAQRIMGLALAFPLIAVIAAPGVALVIHRHGLKHDSAYYELLTREVEKDWRSATAAPLRLVGGANQLINGIAFYAADGPSTFDVESPSSTPWADEPRWTREGVAWVCPVDDAVCVKAIEAYSAKAPDRRRTEVTLTRTFLGIPGPPHSYLVIVAPPVPSR